MATTPTPALGQAQSRATRATVPAEGARGVDVSGSVSVGLIGGLFERLFGGGRRERRAPQEVAATGTVMLPRHMQRKRRYTITIRVVGKQPEAVHAVAFTDAAQVGKRDLGKLPKGAHITVEAAQTGDAFDLPQPRVTLDVPAPDALSEARMPVVARRLSATESGDRLTFTFRGPQGETLHAEPLTADVVVVESVPGGATDILTLVHQITVLV
jgi:hypothetical protein